MQPISLLPRYAALPQKTNDPAFACLQMILQRHDYPVENAFRLAARMEPRKTALHPVRDAERLNSFFRETGIALTATVVKRADIWSMTNFLLDNLRKGNDLWITYSPETSAHKKPTPLTQNALIESFQITKGTVTLLDPAHKNTPRITLGLPALKAATTDTERDSTGFVVVRRLEESGLEHLSL